MSTDGWTDKQNVVYSHDELSFGLKRKNILPYATTQMNLEDIILSEISQSQKDKSCMIPFIRGTWHSQVHRDRKLKGGCQVLGGGGNGE